MKKISRRSALQILAGTGAAALALPRVFGQTAPATAPGTASAPARGGRGGGRGAPPSDPPGTIIPPAPTPIVAPPGFGVTDGPFKPTLESLSAYKIPEWYRDAKFGIWAHWGPQCQPEMGDWYAQKMYQYSTAANSIYQFHLKKYGHPSKFGFKDVINEWKADKWDPVALIALYKKAGAKFFAAMANHHDNMDMFDSTYQPWNSVRIGPKKDLVGGWMKAARDAGLRFAISSHGDRSWDWMQVARGADPADGSMPGVQYDGMMTKADGKGKWWEGLDPQDLYGQYHARGNYQWTLAGNPPVDQSYKDKFFNRTIDLINKYQPDLLYFDDTVLPMFGADLSVGTRIAAYLYNTNLARKGKLEVVMTGKGLNGRNADWRNALVFDVERGQATVAETAIPWQTDTCIGNWHYERSLFDRHTYKTAKQCIWMLVDIVSKNGNLMLDIPLRGDGTIDDDELKCVQGIGKWMELNGEGIFATRPFAVYGEGPSTANATAGRFGGTSDVPKFVDSDVRYTQKGDIVYAFLMGWAADGKATLKTLAAGAASFPREIAKVELIGGGALTFTRDTAGLVVNLPPAQPDNGGFAYTLRISPR